MLLGIEIGGTKLQACLEHETGTRHWHTGRVDRAAAAAGTRAWLAGLPKALQIDRGALTGVGVGFGGPVDVRTGRVVRSHHIDGWDDFALAHWCTECFGAPTAIDNDANAAALAEARLGAGQGHNPFFYMNMGSGIGGGLVEGGQVHHGGGRSGMEIGHTLVPDGWDRGAPVRLEDRCSGWNIEARLARPGYVPADSPLAACRAAPTCRDLGEAASGGDAFARAELERIGEAVGVALANVLALCAPTRFALGGGVAGLGERLLAPVRTHLARHAMGIYAGTYDVVPCAFGQEVVVIGALELARDVT